MQIQPDKMATTSTGQPPPSDSHSERPLYEQTLDEIVANEHKEIAELDKTAAASTEEEKVAAEAEPDPKAQDNEGKEVVAEDEEAEVEGEGEYKPNTKYKVLDKELEFDPKLHAALNADTEPVIRELYEKAHGIDTIKEKLVTTRGERDQAATQLHALNSEVQRTLGYAKAGDLDSFFEAVGMTPQQIGAWVLEKAQIEALPPEQKAVYTEREMLRKRMNALENNFQNVNATNESQQVNAIISELDRTLTSEPTTQSVAQAFDARNGAGSYRKAIMAHGAAEFHASRKVLSVPEAISSFNKTYGLEAPKAATKPVASATARVVAKPKAATIPSFGKSQTSATAEKKPKSIDELRKYAKEKYG